jgi:hypothetical protein
VKKCCGFKISRNKFRYINIVPNSFNNKLNERDIKILYDRAPHNFKENQKNNLKSSIYLDYFISTKKIVLFSHKINPKNGSIIF